MPTAAREQSVGGSTHHHSASPRETLPHPTWGRGHSWWAQGGKLNHSWGQIQRRGLTKSSLTPNSPSSAPRVQLCPMQARGSLLQGWGKEVSQS